MTLKNTHNILSFYKNVRSIGLALHRRVHRDLTFSSSVPSHLMESPFAKCNAQESQLFLQRPVRKNSFIKTFENHRDKVVLVDPNGEFLYEDILRRSLDLAAIIGDLFKYENKITDHKICFLCPSGVSFLLATLACWLSGNTAVPLNIYQNKEVLEYILAQNESPFVIVTKECYDKIYPIAKVNKRQIIVLDSSWTGNAVKSFDTDIPLPCLFNEHFYHGDRNGMILYTTGTTTGIPKPVTLNHFVIDARLKKIVDAWDLKREDCSLHAIPLQSHFGIIETLLAPISVGGKVVLLKSSNPTKVWSHLLGIGLDSNKSIHHKTNVFPSLPHIYNQLIESHKDLFHNRKIRDYVKASCTKKVRLMTCGGGSIPISLRIKWKRITGHTIVDTYTTTEVGTVLCSNISKPELATKCVNCCTDEFFKPLPRIEARVVRFLDNSKDKYDVLTEDSEEDKGIVGELLIENKDEHIPYVDGNGWFSTGDIVRLKGGRLQVIGKIIKNPVRNFRKIERQFSKYDGIIDCYVFGIDADPSELKMSLATVLAIDPNLTKSSLEQILTDYKEK
ncbi:malonate--CoA ligase ACSF3, mitochondrial [Lepeophtheirus salmonis]|uniref:malonate--CoA ligase ACSF3, mitochondrial n=1 Tax=Lepeophtheirus salmonis TaxID=72036 RepID=UPI001AE5AA49|nr:malonate--CoA ligase ACSF3, mitochondrial-like [Lepeophtheirus salmonis]